MLSKNGRQRLQHAAASGQPWRQSVLLTIWVVVICFHQASSFSASGCMSGDSPRGSAKGLRAEGEAPKGLLAVAGAAPLGPKGLTGVLSAGSGGGGAGQGRAQPRNPWRQRQPL